jgi:hypothetical protein
MAQQEKEHWLDRYANNHHPWHLSTSIEGRKTFKRPLGLVETSFDTDGTYYGGRADMTVIFKLAIRHTLSQSKLRKRIALAWTSLRLQHVILMSRVEDDIETGTRYFAVDLPTSTQTAIEDVEKSIVWLEDHDYDRAIDEKDLHHHALNTSRIIRPQECLSKLHVLPLLPLRDGTLELRFLIVMAHQISDGLSAYNWFNHFLRILNSPLSTISADISSSIQPEKIRKKLPPAQEDLYPKPSGTKARQRWFWAITRVLRHVQKTMPPTFTNPLRRETRLVVTQPLDPRYEGIFDYSPSSRPPVTSGHIAASLSALASKRLISLCRSANVSVGAGCFALAGLSMMAIHESRYSTIPSSQRPAFSASFPLNPRAFFNVKTEADSCMLAFSEGIVMPFLPSHLPLEGRFRLVAKHANRELRVYQKRLKDPSLRIASFDKHSPGRLLATGYLAQIERVEAKLPEEWRKGYDPQGGLKARVGQYGATCGVSSVGSTAAFFRPGEYDLNNMGDSDFVADYRGLRMGVRAREYEFLVGSSTDAEGIVGFGVSYDQNAISAEAAEKWAVTISDLLEREDGPKL